MKTIAKFAALVASTSLLASAASAATTATGTASATVIGPLSIVQTTAMSFGSFSSGTTAGTVNSYGSTTGGVIIVSSTATPAVFTVTGTPNTNFNITGPASMTLTSGLNNLTAALTVPTVSATDGSGNRAFNVTGILTVPANTPSGAYTGTYNVSVSY